MGGGAPPVWGAQPIPTHRLSPHAARVPRVIVLWQHPNALSRDEAAAWAHRETGGLTGAEGIESVRLCSMLAPPESEPRRYDWMLELEVTSANVASRPLLRGLLSDLRLMGMRPLVLVPDDGFAPPAAA